MRSAKSQALESLCGSRTRQVSPRVRLHKIPETAACSTPRAVRTARRAVPSSNCRAHSPPCRTPAVAATELLTDLRRNWRRRLTRHFRRILKLLQNFCDCRIQLYIVARIDGQRVQGDLDVGRDSLILDPPFAFRREDAEKRYREKAAVDQLRIRGDANQAAPGAGADQLTEAKTPESVG